MKDSSLISTIGYDQIEIINNIIKLYCPNGIELDPTYSKGNFYKNGVINQPKYKFDLYPQTEDTIKASAENLPFEDNSISSIMFDPPFLATTGKSLTEKLNLNNKINKRFGVFPTEKKLYLFYFNCLKEFKRILKDNGILIFKCQDKVSSSKQYFSHLYIMNKAIDIGFYCQDLFILLAKNRIVANWQIKNQQHARKFHSYFLVFKNTNKKIIYE